MEQWFDGPTVGDRIRAAREAAGLEVVDLDRLSGVDRSAISQVESGASKQPSFQNGLRIAGALKVDPWLLAFGKQAPASSLTASTAGGMELLSAGEVQEMRSRIDELWSQHLTILEAAKAEKPASRVDARKSKKRA